jgi:hypothetical protein
MTVVSRRKGAKLSAEKEREWKGGSLRGVRGLHGLGDRLSCVIKPI